MSAASMRVAGSRVLRAPRERVWDALADPAVLARALPGCRELEPMGADAYRLRVAGVVASVAGEYSGVVRVVERSRPGAVTFRATGAGASGTVEGDVRLVLRADEGGSTRAEYDAEGEVDGALGAVGSRLLAAFGRRVGERFLAEVEAAVGGGLAESEVQQGGPPPTQSQQGGPPPTPAGPATPAVRPQHGHHAATSPTTPRTLAAFALGLLAGLGLGLGLGRRR
jgi:carbon monoxide dehydrogenase subunit G